MTYGRQRGHPVPDGITLRPPGRGDHPPPHAKGGAHSGRSTSSSVPAHSSGCGPPTGVASAEAASMGPDKLRASSPTIQHFTLKEPLHDDPKTGPPGIRLPHDESMSPLLTMDNGPPGALQKCETASLGVSFRKELFVQEGRAPPGSSKPKGKDKSSISSEGSHDSWLHEHHERRRRPRLGLHTCQAGFTSGRGKSRRAPSSENRKRLQTKSRSRESSQIYFISRNHPHGSN